MSKLKIYGIVMSRTFRVLWAADELGLDYEHHKTDFNKGEHKTPEFLAINPLGHIPAIDDDGFVMFESLAICHYLARKHAGEISPRDLKEEAASVQWAMWVATTAEPHALTILMQRAILPADKRDAAVEQAAADSLAAAFDELAIALKGRQWLAADRFTISDLHVASVLSWAAAAKFDLGRWPEAAAWLNRCLSRPAAQKWLNP